jgi:acyl-CoA thioesterase
VAGRRGARATGRALGSRRPMSEPDTNSFTAALAMAAAEGRAATATLPAGWAQGRATFGGLLLAQALAAARARLPEPRPCRALVATFPAPLSPGPVELPVRELRHGRAVSQLQVEVRRGDEVGCVALAVFGGDRPSTITVAPPPPPSLPPAGELPSLLASSGLAPEFTRHFEMRLGRGGHPYSGADSREITGWCRFRDEPGPLLAEHVVALVDAWPSPAVARFAAPAPASSVTWSLELLPVDGAASPGDWWLYHAELESAGDGYAHSAARLWSPAGRLVALSRQAVAVFA